MEAWEGTVHEEDTIPFSKTRESFESCSRLEVLFGPP